MEHKRQFNYYTFPDDPMHMNYVDNMHPSMYGRSTYVCPCQYEAAQPVFQPQSNPGGQNDHINKEPKESTPEQQLLQQFLTKDGQVDVQKMLKTIGQFANTVQQVSPVIKEINDIIKSFRT